MTEIQYELREQDLLAFNDFQLKNTESLQKTLRRHQATIPGLLILIAVFVWFGYQDTLTAAWIASPARMARGNPACSNSFWARCTRTPVN